MIQRLHLGSVLVMALAWLVTTTADAQQHRATRLGNPATRFADPLRTPEDLRKMLTTPKLRTDVEFIARESGYKGDLAELQQAASNAPITEIKVPVGTRLQAMSTRENGKAVLLRDVLWAGKEPFEAYEFHFASQGRRYRVVTPKPCANFWVEDAGPDLRPTLVLRCETPAEAVPGRPVPTCLVLSNSGEAVETAAAVALAIPEGATVANVSGDGKTAAGRVTWQIQNLAPGASTNLCVELALPYPGNWGVASAAQGSRSPVVESRCDIRVTGVPAILLEVIDLDDPIEVGKEQTYEIVVVNQGTAVLTGVKVVCTLEDSQEFVSGGGTSAVQALDRTLTMNPLPALNPKAKAAWKVVVKTLKAGDVRFTTELNCDQLRKTITESEATQQY